MPPVEIALGPLGTVQLDYWLAIGQQQNVRRKSMTSRDDERNVLGRCAAAARGDVMAAFDQREANVFRLAAMVLQSRLPVESGRLMHASDQYFRLHPTDKMSSAEVVRKGWVLGLPRLRDMLTMQLRPH